MSIFEKLPEKEVEMIDNYISTYASEGNYERVASIKYLLRIWDSAKSEYLYDMLGQNFILSKQIEFNKSYNDIIKELDDMFSCNIKVDKFHEAYMDFLTNINGRVEEGAMYDYRHLISPRWLANNIYEGENHELEDLNGKIIKLQTGAKVTRILGKIAAGFNLPDYEEFRICHSQVLNQKKLRGNLCLSIHPLDYMTMSDNANGWTSSMSWQENGCYRQGTVEMMNSPMVVVAYLTSSCNMGLPGGGEWNSKKWRQLFIVNPNFIGNVKAYPYQNDSLTAAVLDWLKELAETVNLGEYHSKMTQYDTSRDFDINGKWYCIDPYTNLMYNDFSDNQFAYISKKLSEGTYEFCYSGESECMCCGETFCEFDHEGSLLGDCCGKIFFCDSCRDHYYSEDDLIELDGNYYCQYCFQNYAIADDLTGEVHHRDNIVNIYLADDDKAYYNHVIHVFYDYFNNSDLNYYFTKIRRRYSPFEDIIYVKPEDCTEEGLKLFGYEGYIPTEVKEKISDKRTICYVPISSVGEKITEYWYNLTKWLGREEDTNLIFNLY